MRGINTPIPVMEKKITQKISKDIQDLYNNINQLVLTDIEYSTQEQQNTSLFLIDMKHSPRHTILWITEQPR